MVKNKSAKILALAIGAALFLWTGLVVGGEKAEKVLFGATEIPTGLVDPGIATTPDGNYHVRDQIFTFHWDSAEDRVVGTVTVVINMNLDSLPIPGVIASGPMWGTFNFPSVYYENSGWDGSWHGQVFDIVGFQLEHGGVGHGYGEFEGLQMKYSCTRTLPNPYVASCTGRILETNRK
jgi:hypothetical protein